MNIACCPYCESTAFSSEVLRADAVDTKHPERFALVEGYWFNQCLSCRGWSLHKCGQQTKLDNPQERPEAYSLPPFE